MNAVDTERQEEEKTAMFVRVAECLYRHATSGVYYALVKRKGRQIRRSLETNDRKLAEKALADFRQSAQRLSMQSGAGRLTFTDIANRWLATVKPGLKARTGNRRGEQLVRLKKTFGRYAIRQITSAI